MALSGDARQGRQLIARIGTTALEIWKHLQGIPDKSNAG
jgi:hypothetical protein